MTLETSTDRIDVSSAARLRGSPALPGDKSISHRALLLALLARGRSTIASASGGGDVAATAAVIERLGARVSRSVDARRRASYEVQSGGAEQLGDAAANVRLECGNSGTTLRLTAGLVAGHRIRAVLDGDASLRRRPMARIAEPLRAMGAEVAMAMGETAPVIVHGAELHAIDWTSSVASAQVKSAILLAGLRAHGVTRVHEPVPTRDHTERMLRARGVPVRSLPGPGGGAVVEIEGGHAVGPRDEAVPGDPSAAAFWLVAAAAHPDAWLQLPGVGVNPGRRGAIDILGEMGAEIDERPSSRAAPDDEPVADLLVGSSGLRAVDVDARRAVAAIDEIPVLCLAATQATGVSWFRGVGELRVKESDRLAGIVDGLSAFGADVSADGDDVRVAGPTPLRGATVDGLGDHRLVMTFAIAGLLASGSTTITGAAHAAISDPGFIAELERIRS